MIEPRSVSHRTLDVELGYLRVATFPGAVGLDFAKSLGTAINDLIKRSCKRLIIDLRGNVGGGLGSLRLMSYLSPEKLPIGHSLTRSPASKRLSEREAHKDRPDSFQQDRTPFNGATVYSPSERSVSPSRY